MAQTREALAAWLRLLGTPGVGNDTARRLLQAFGLPEQVLAQPLGALRQVIPTRVAEALARPPAGLQAQTDTLIDATWQWLQDAPDGRTVISLGDDDYPPALLEIPDPPCLLYAQGRIEALQTLRIDHCLAVVGSRNPTPQGRLNAQAFARDLAGRGMTIVSGLALGVDGAAHEGALEGAGTDAMPTVAVVGTGLDRVYPKQHLALAHRIVERGLILSEYPLGTPPLNANFPRRNRILSGLSQGVLVVEAALESGSLITARQALEQGREVFAIPGSIHSPQSKGCHALIRQGAKLVECAQDVLEELHQSDPFAQVPLALDTPPAPASSDEMPPVAGQPDRLLALLGHEPCSLDALLARSGLDTAQLQARLLDLELEGQVHRLPGGLFQRLVRG